MTPDRREEPRKATGGPEGDRQPGADYSDYRLRKLYEISKRLTSFDGVEQTVPSVIAIAAEALDLRSAILILERNERPEAILWQVIGGSAAELDEAKARARRSYGYLLGSGADLWATDRVTLPLPRTSATERDEPVDFILLPLVVDGEPIFGALQLEGSGGLGEQDLMFVSAIANQLAIAMARHASNEVRHAIARAARVMAEQSEERLRAKFDFVRDATASLGEGIVVVDLKERITMLNRAAEELLGLTADDILRPIADVLTVKGSNGPFVAADCLPWTVAIRQGVVVRSDEHLFAAAPQPAFPVSYTAAPLRHDGRIEGAVLAFRDIIDLKRAEAEQRLLSTVSGVLAASLDYRTTLAAVARAAVPTFADLCFIDEMLETGAVERVELVFADATKEARFAERIARFAPRPGCRTPQQRVLESKAPILIAEVAEYEMIAQDDDHARILREIAVKSIVVVPLCVRDEIMGVVSFVMAESDRRYSASDLALAREVAHRTAMAIDNARLYAAARQATRTRDDLLAMVSHDLKSPLSVILMNIELLRIAGESACPPKQLNWMMGAAQTMNSLIQDLLDTASIEAGSLSIAPRSVAARSIVAEAIEPLRLLAASASHILENEVPDDLPDVCADAGRVQQVITNLVGNAIKFTPPGGIIRIRGLVVGTHVQLSVADSGTGISEQDLPHLFDRFWQAKRTGRRGSGLGLFIAKGIVAAHGGRLSAESTVGVGSTFFFTLPIAEEAQSVRPNVGGQGGDEGEGCNPVGGA